MIQDSVRLILIEEFVIARAKNPRYSMRSYAKKIGLAQSAVSEIIAGKRSISEKMAEKALRGLGRDTAEIALIRKGQSKDKNPFKSLEDDVYHLISDWYYYAILSLMETEGFISSPRWIASRLDLTQSVVEEAVDRLISLDLVRKDSKGTLKVSGERLSATSKKPNAALKKANEQNLMLAMNAHNNVPVDARDFSSLTLCFDPDRMAEARKLIANFRKDFDRIMEAGRKKEVYKVCIQLFPVTQSK